MRYKLEDNTQEAFQFLLLGAAIVLVLRAVIGLAGLWMGGHIDEALVGSIAEHRSGFILTDPLTIVAGGMDIYGRLAYAALLTLIAGVAGSVGGAALSRIFNGPTIPWAVAGARAGLIIMAAAGLYSALFLPAHTVTITPHAAMIHKRATLPGGLALPWTVENTEVAWQTVTGIRQRVRDHGPQACGIQQETVLISNEGIHLLARSVPSGVDCDESIADHRERAQRLEALISERYLRPNG